LFSAASYGLPALSLLKQQRRMLGSLMSLETYTPLTRPPGWIIFAIQLQRDPTAKGFIVVYRSHRDLPGLSGRHARWMTNYLVANRGLQANRVVMIDGETASCLVHEFWIVPAGKTPEPRADAYVRSFIGARVARKFDEFGFTLPSEQLESFSPEYETGFEGFAEALLSQPQTMGVVIAYGYYGQDLFEKDAQGQIHRYRDTTLDSPLQITQQLNDWKRMLVNQLNVPGRRLRMVNGGFRAGRTVELWLVPLGARQPIPTPNVYPPRRKSR